MPASRKKHARSKTAPKAKAVAIPTQPQKPRGRPRSLPEFEAIGEDLKTELTEFKCRWRILVQGKPRTCDDLVPAYLVADHIRTHIETDLREEEDRNATGEAIQKDVMGEQDLQQQMAEAEDTAQKGAAEGPKDEAEKDDGVICKWAGCKAKTTIARAGMSRHVKGHLDLIQLTCIWCGRRGRRDSYRRRHDSARTCGKRQARLTLLVTGSYEVFEKTMQELCDRGGSPSEIARIVQEYVQEDAIVSNVASHFRCRYDIDIVPPPSSESAPSPADSSGPMTPPPNEPQAGGSNSTPSYDHPQFDFLASYPPSFNNGLLFPGMAPHQPTAFQAIGLDPAPLYAHPQFDFLSSDPPSFNDGSLFPVMAPHQRTVYVDADALPICGTSGAVLPDTLSAAEPSQWDEWITYR
ncbi:hypothetical protein ONZ51_g4880 [Trametes cubensis]|uniref:Uncharacterized protein n=1 Tax=Trametes cubensis TaxID=1111947 RepID=A0AAD7X9W9_9APHY|nr:hypothetical protein ONZ51_g4880 [Trametes cubensis]